MHIAVLKKQLPSIRFLLELGADLTIKNESGNTPQHEVYDLRDLDFLNITDRIFAGKQIVDDEFTEEELEAFY
jgi:ankyrin repeat protein